MNPMPSYAIIIVVGLLERVKLSSGRTLWAEKTFIQQSTKVFAECADFKHILQFAEEFYCFYMWGKIS